MLQKIVVFVRENIKWLRWLVSITFLILVIWRVDWRQMFSQIVTANLPLILVAVVVGYGAYWILSSRRWQIFLNAFGLPYNFGEAFTLNLIGFFAGFALSDSVGAFVRGFYAKNKGYSVEKAMITIFLDKLAEFMGLFLFGLIGLFVFSAAIAQEWLIWLSVLGSVTVGVGVLWLLHGKLGFWLSQRLDRLLANRFRLTNKRPAAALYQDLRSISAWIWLRIVMLTILRRLTHYGAVYILAKSLGIPLSYISIMAIMSLVGIAVVLPISVAGGIGVREGVLVGLFALLGQEKELALSLALLIFLCTLIWRIVGLVFWLKNPLGKQPGMISAN